MAPETELVYRRTMSLRALRLASVLRFSLLALAGSLLASACGAQGEGERCNADNGNDDCQEGLVCKTSRELESNADICCPEVGPSESPECTPGGVGASGGGGAGPSAGGSGAGGSGAGGSGAGGSGAGGSGAGGSGAGGSGAGGSGGAGGGSGAGGGPTGGAGGTGGV